jgi:predicted metalloprotease with PDZ domain
MAMGKLAQRQVDRGKLSLAIASPAADRQGSDMFASALEPVIAKYESIMGGAPTGKLAVILSISDLASGGEAFSHSISMSMRQMPSMSNKSRWAYLICHEVFHLWNGQAIQPAKNADVEWFSEGFTDYMANLVAYRTGLMTQDELFNQLANCYDTYLEAAAKGVSMKEGGKAKGANYPLLYFGGMSTAIALDIESRTHNPQQGGFPNLMKAMYEKFGKTHQPYSYEELVETAGKVAGEDLKPFFQTYVAGTTLIPVQSYLASAGLTLTSVGGSSSISINPNASSEQRALLSAVLRN